MAPGSSPGRCTFLLLVLLLLVEYSSFSVYSLKNDNFYCTTDCLQSRCLLGAKSAIKSRIYNCGASEKRRGIVVVSLSLYHIGSWKITICHRLGFELLLMLSAILIFTLFLDKMRKESFLVYSVTKLVELWRALEKGLLRFKLATKSFHVTHQVVKMYWILAENLLVNFCLYNN